MHSHEDDLDISIDDKVELDPKHQHQSEVKTNNNFVASVGNVFRKALSGIKLLKLGLSS